MKLRNAGAVLVLVLAACATGPQSFTVQAPAPAGDTYSCLLREINLMEYTIVDADREAAFIRAERMTSSGLTQVFTGRRYYNVITASVYDDAQGGMVSVRITVAQSNESLFGGSRVANNPPSQGGREDARAILEACGQGEVVGPGD